MMFSLTSSGHTRVFVRPVEGWMVLFKSMSKTFGTA